MRSTELKEWNDIAKFKGDSWFEEKVIQKFRRTMDLRPLKTTENNVPGFLCKVSMLQGVELIMTQR